MEGTVVSAHKVFIPDEVSGSEEEERAPGIFNRAVGKELKVRYIRMGEPPFDHDLLIVLDDNKNIEQLKVDTQVLAGIELESMVSGPPMNLCHL